MAYRIAGIDVHKKMLAGVVADVEGEPLAVQVNPASGPGRAAGFSSLSF
jgi:hypothetical protein